MKTLSIIVVSLILGCTPVPDDKIPRCKIEWMETYINKCVEHCTYGVSSCDGTCIKVAKEKYCN